MIKDLKISALFKIFLITTLLGCAAQESFLNDGKNDAESEDLVDGDNSNTETPEALQFISSLADIYTSNSNNVPDVFSEIKKEKEVEVDLTKGFRIQIYSGEDVFEADTVASTFRAWSDTTLVGYQAETYTFFKAPYYKVHIGDFHSRNRALNFSKMVKRLFRDAWVVYDTVNPYLVPEDSTKIEFQDL